jgi:hypothetical protein
MNDSIPEMYTCDGKDVNPPLLIEDIPENTACLVLIVDDPDASMGTFTHWIIWNISPKNKINENTALGIEGVNDFGKVQYNGPCPPGGSHRYYFKLYALDDMLSLQKGEHREKLVAEMQDHIIESCNTMGRYKKKI